MSDKLYDEFYDPSEDFLLEPRAFCYEIATQLINQAKRNSINSWYEDIETIKGILLLLYVWNFAAQKTKKLTYQNVSKLLHKTKTNLEFVEKYSISTADNETWNIIKLIFDQFNKLFDQTGASKALSLLNPELFVMWDTAIRKRLNRELIPGIMNGNNGEYYVVFLKGIQDIIKKYRIAEKLPENVVLAKKIDEYHYVRLVMNKKVKQQKVQEVRKPRSPRIYLPDNIRGRSIHSKVIPTVCNLKNTLVKLREVHKDISLLKPWEKRSYDAYRLDRIKIKTFIYHEEYWKEIIRNHILHENPSELGASCIDIYLVAYVAETFGSGKKRFFQYVKENGISKKDVTAQAIWQVGKGDGVFLEILHNDGTIKDVEFIKKWVNGYFFDHQNIYYN
jgi:hypothetical protein